MLFLSLIKFHIYITSKMLGLLQGLPLSGNDLANVIGQKIVVKDPKVIPHIANILSYVSKNKAEGGLQHISNIAKQTQPKINNNTSTQEQLPISIPLSDQRSEVKGYSFGRFSNDVQKLQLAGYGLPLDEVFLMEVYLKVIAQQYNAKQVRFWGKILGIWRDYYVIQGVAQQPNYLENIGKGDEKRGEGANYYTFWVSTNLAQDEWTELPLITTQHVKVARKIKTRFTGNLQKPIDSYPEFPGEQSHYLKAQLVRMTSSLQLVPKGIYKPNDQNPKITQFQDEPKVPQFGELSTIQTWVHRNQNLLHLGRCTHYIDPATPEDQLEAVTAQLTEKDPEVERLRSITQDKLPEGNQYGLENIWQIRNVGVSQVFQKDEASNVYGAVVLKNLYWPGWVTIGYKGGFVNYYTGFGHKWSQAAWNQYQNPNLGQQAEQPQQFREPNPKDEPKVVAEVPAQQAPQE